MILHYFKLFDCKLIDLCIDFAYMGIGVKAAKSIELSILKIVVLFNIATVNL